MRRAICESAGLTPFLRADDSVAEAVLVSGDAGATTSTIWSVYLISTGSSVNPKQRDQSLFDADHVKNLKLVWREPKLLEIQYEEARILNFRNFWYGPNVQSARHIVELRLGPSTNNFALPLRDRM